MSTMNGVAAPSVLDVLTLDEAAAYLQIPPNLLREEATAGRVVGKAVGADWRFARGDLLAWLRTPGAVTPARLSDWPVSDETEEEFQAFLAQMEAHRDEIDRATGFGKYAPE